MRRLADPPQALGRRSPSGRDRQGPACLVPEPDELGEPDHDQDEQLVAPPNESRARPERQGPGLILGPEQLLTAALEDRAPAAQPARPLPQPRASRLESH